MRDEGPPRPSRRASLDVAYVHFFSTAWSEGAGSGRLLWTAVSLAGAVALHRARRAGAMQVGLQSSV